jgi:hypothetical protein
MKKNLIIFLLILLSFSNINAVQYWGEGLFADFGFSSKTFIPNPVPLEGSIGYRKEFKEINIFSGICFDDFSFDFSASGAVKPLQYERFQFAMGYLSHFSFSYKSEYLNELFINDNVFLSIQNFLEKISTIL